jgi:hypothetical protein
MKNGLLKSVVLGALVAGAMSVSVARADTIVTVDPTAIKLGYMNVFNLPGDGGAFQFASGWALGDLTATYAGSNLTLGPNTIGDPNPYWYIGGGAPGSPGNKIMEANCYAEPAGSLPGQNVTFTGTVLSNTLTAAHPTTAFIKDFAADFSSFNVVSVPLPASGTFSITLATVADPARHVQYGFQMTGVNVWVTDTAPFGHVTVGPAVPTPVANTTWGGLKALYK